jgi:hypothetical protein
MSQLKEYIIAAKTYEDLNSIYEDMESFTKGKYGQFPERIVECFNRRVISRNTGYYLTDKEALDVAKDPRIESISIAPQHIKNFQIIHDWTLTGTFAKVSEAEALPTDLNWNLLRTFISENPNNWYRGNIQKGDADDGIKRFTGIVSTTLEGANVDLIIVELGQIYPLHEDFIDSQNNSRIVVYNWLQHSNKLFGRPNGTYSYTDTGAADNFHTTGVAGLAAGVKSGWAKKSNLYSIRIKSTSTSQNDNAIFVAEVYDYIREFHRTKPVNASTGRKNPTIVNNSWSLGGGSNYYDFNNFKTITFRGTTYIGPFSNVGVGSLRYWQLGLGNLDLQVNTNFYPYPNFMDADIVDSINDGIIVVVSGGNNAFPFSKQNHIDYFNKIELKNPVNGISELYYNRPQGIKNERAILVGALGYYKTNAGTKNYSDNNRSLIYYQTDGEEVEYYSARGAGINVFATTEGLTAKYNTINQRITLNGTSGAAPNVTGVLACLLERNPEWTQQDCIDYINRTSTRNKLSDAAYVDSISFGEYSLNGAPNAILHYTESLTYTGISQTPISVSITPDKLQISEGQNVTWNIITSGLPNNSKIFWLNFGTASKENFVEGVDSGIVTINNNYGTFTLTSIADLTTELETENIKIKLFLSGFYVTEIAESSPVLLIDSSRSPILTKTYAISGPVQAPEFSTVRFTINTTNVTNGTLLYYNITGTNIDLSDVSSLNGSFEIIEQNAILDIDLTKDEITEGNEIFTLSVYTDFGYTNAVTSTNLIIQDTSLTPTYNISPSSIEVPEGGTIEFTVITTNLLNGTKLYWRNIGTTTSLDFVGGATTGTITINNNTAIFNLQIAEDLPFEINQTIEMTIRRSGWDGAILTSTNVVVGENSFFCNIIPGTPQNPITNYNEGQVVNFTITAYNFGSPTTSPPTSGITSYTVTAANFRYYFSGLTGENPTLTLIRGNTYNFIIETGSLHPFWIKTAATIGQGDQYNTGVTNNGTYNNIITFIVPSNAPNTLYYACENHNTMQGIINIIFTTTTTQASTIIYWNNIGTTTARDFSNNINFGTLEINQTSTILSLATVNDKKTEKTIEGNYETLVIQIRNTSNQVIQTSRNVRIFDTSQDEKLLPIKFSNLPNILTTDPALYSEYSSLPIWEKTGNIGLLEVNETSELFIKSNTTQTFNIVYKLVSGSLPEGISLLRDGTIAGVVTATNFLSTYNQFNFVAGIGKTVGNTIFTATFQLTVLKSTSTYYTQIYLRPLMIPKDRNEIQNFLKNKKIFDPKFIYRPYDNNFGVSKDLRLYIHYGIESVSPEAIAPFMENYYRRKFLLSKVKIAYAFDDNNKPLYEVIYSDIIDYNITTDGESIPTFFVYRYYYYFPSSIYNMRKNLEANLKFTNNFNPRFMRSKQPGNFNELGYIPCVIYCYVLPGKGKIVLNRINKSNIDFSIINFDINQINIRQLNQPIDIPVRYSNRNGSILGGSRYT